jgi:hypothetical protein
MKLTRLTQDKNFFNSALTGPDAENSAVSPLRILLNNLKKNKTEIIKNLVEILWEIFEEQKKTDLA